jgi:HK97 family phage major capsid protein
VLQWPKCRYEPTKTKPKIAQLMFTPDTLIAECWGTGELYMDAPTLGANLTRVFSSEIAFKLDDAIISGPGVGTPVGILSSLH